MVPAWLNGSGPERIASGEPKSAQPGAFANPAGLELHQRDVQTRRVWLQRFRDRSRDALAAYSGKKCAYCAASDSTVTR
jgi:hypothetical protein